VYSDLVVGGVAPYLDLPATAMDTYGRSGRGYGEGRFRGERLFDTFAPGGGLGLRLLINKHSKTNLCLDFGLGEQG
jgi:hypothetical protein